MNKERVINRKIQVKGTICEKEMEEDDEKREDRRRNKRRRCKRGIRGDDAKEE